MLPHRTESPHNSLTQNSVPREKNLLKKTFGDQPNGRKGGGEVLTNGVSSTGCFFYLYTEHGNYTALTFYNIPVTWCTNSLTFNNCTFCPHWIYVFCIYLRTNSDLCHLQHKLIGFYNRDEKCLLRGTNWVFKESSLRFVFKWLNEVKTKRLYRNIVRFR